MARAPHVAFIRPVPSRSAPSPILRRRPTSQAAHVACGAVVASVLLAANGARAQAQDAAAPVSTLQTITVRGKAERADDLPAAQPGGQTAKGARLGVLGNMDIMDAPFNVTSYTAELIDNRQARTLGDLLLSDPAVRFTTSNGHPYENFRIRGFDVNQNDIAFNGMFGVLPLGHVPLEFVERVEVLKGPNALFSGMAPSGGIGGVVNLVPKRAGDVALTRVSLGVVDSGQAEIGVDLGRRFGERKEWGLRVNAAYGDGETPIEGRKNRRELLSVALDYRGDGLTASLDAYTVKEAFRGGTSAMFWFASTAIPEAPSGKINQFPGASGELDSKGLILRGEYQFAPRLSVFAAAGAMNHDSWGFINGTHVRNINATGVSTATTMGAQRNVNDDVAAEGGLRFGIDTGPVSHDFVLQASHLDQDSGSATAVTSAAYTTDIYSPTYRDMPALPGAASKTAENTLQSLALVDTMSFMDDAVRLTLGLRRQKIQTVNLGNSTTTYDLTATTPAVAVVVKPWGPSVSLYANYVEGLSKGASVAKANGYVSDYTFAPFKTRQKEAGVKWAAGGYTNTFSVFEIALPILRSAGTTPNMTAAYDGEKRVRGLEWNVLGQVTAQVRLLGGIAYSKGEQTQSTNAAFNGNDAVGVPRWQGNLGAEWDLPWLPGLTLTSQLIGSAHQYINSANTQITPGWGTVDLGLRYATRLDGRPLVLRLTAFNAFDKNYYAGAFSDTTPIATLGSPRSVALSASMDF